jgi:hypothetical protein
MYREFFVTFNKGLRAKGSPRYYEDGECSIVQDCYVDDIGNIFTRKFMNLHKNFDYEIKTIFFYNYINRIVVHLINGDFKDLNAVDISTTFGPFRLSCVEYDDILYMVNSIVNKRYDGTNVHNIGNTAPATAATGAVGAAGNLNGDYYWKYTYVDNNGKESNYSPASAVVAAANEKVNVTVTASSDSKIASINLYRLGGTLTQWYQVSTGNANTTGAIEDNVADSDLSVLGIAEINDPPETGLSFLTEHYERLVGAKSRTYPNSISFTVPYEPEYWGETLSQQYLISNKDECTGLLSWGRYIIFCKRKHKYVLEGENPYIWHKRKSDAFYGNIAPAALAFYNFPITLSKFGLHVFDGNNDLPFTDLIEDFFSEHRDYLEEAIGCVFNDRYYLSIPSQSVVLVYDFSLQVFYTYNIKLTEMYYDYKNALLYAGDGSNNLVTLENDENVDNFDSINFKVKSQAYKLNDRDNDYGKLRRIIVCIDTNSQDINLNIYIDEELVQTIILNTSEMTRLRYSTYSHLKGRYAEFEFEATGLRKEVEIQSPLIINPLEEND